MNRVDDLANTELKARYESTARCTVLTPNKCQSPGASSHSGKRARSDKKLSPADQVAPNTAGEATEVSPFRRMSKFSLRSNAHASYPLGAYFISNW